MFQMEYMKKFAGIINTLILVFVIWAEVFFVSYGVTYMVYHTIPTIILYLIFYFIIKKELLDIYVWCVYVVITIYMVAATICLGYNYGFHLYCMSLIPITFYMEYYAHKLHTRKTRAFLISGVLVCANLFCTVYVVIKGPVYVLDTTVAATCMVVNACCVFLFLIIYSAMQHKLVMYSETRLSEMALTDQLTGLFNRHYMLTHLTDSIQGKPETWWIAIADIDDFKKINDHYGHNGGDYVLVEMSKIMKELCKKCTISRWGGEEFLIAACGGIQDISLLEELRQQVANTKFSYQNKNIDVSISVGTSYYQEGQSLDSWIQDADKKLYKAKADGKNQVVY